MSYQGGLFDTDPGFDLHHRVRNVLLRWPGGKAFGGKKILPHFKIANLKRLVSPFLGGGAMEITLARCGVEVIGCDADELLVNFWQQVLSDPQAVAEQISPHYPQTVDTYYPIRNRLREAPEAIEPTERAALYFVANRCSFSGLTMSGGGSPGYPRFTPSCIKRIEGFQAPMLQVKHADFKVSIPQSPDDWMYLDPPYAIDNPGLYGKNGNLHKEFDHGALREMLVGRDKWIMSYNDSEYIRKLYQGLRFESVKWSYHMKAGQDANRKSSEVLIFSKDW